MVQGRSNGEEDTEWVSLTFFRHICAQVYVQVLVYIHGVARGELRVFCCITPAYYLLEVKSVAESGVGHSQKATAAFRPVPPSAMELQAWTPTLSFTWVLKTPTQIFHACV